MRVYWENFKLDLADEQEIDGLRMMSKKEPRCVVCGKMIRGEDFKIYSNPANKELKLYVCSEHEDYIKALDTLELPSTENNP